MDDPVDSSSPPAHPTGWEVIRKFYQKWLPPLLIIGTVGWLACVLFIQPPRPPVGTYIAALACLAVVVTIWPPESNWSKAAWLLVFFVITGLEIATLYQERSENQRQQAETHKQEREEFKSIAKGIASTVGVAQNGFTTTLQRIEESNKDITGGRDFVAIEPLVVPMSDNGVSMRAIVMNCDKGPKKCTQGDHVVRSVRAEYVEGRPPYLPDTPTLDSMIAGTRPGYFIGDVPPHLLEAFGLVVRPEKDKGAYYTFNIYALNMFISEAVELRYSSRNDRWDRSIRVVEKNTVLWDDPFAFTRSSRRVP